MITQNDIEEMKSLQSTYPEHHPIHRICEYLITLAKIILDAQPPETTASEQNGDDVKP